MSIIYYFTIMIALIFFIKFFIKSIREGLLILLTFVAFTITALPWETLPEGSSIILQIVAVISPVVYLLAINKNVIEKIKINEYHFYIMLFFITVVAYILISPSIEDGIYKTLIFIRDNLLPIIALTCLAPLKKRDFKIIFYTIAIGSLLAGVKILTEIDVDMTKIEDGSIVLSRYVGLGVVLFWIKSLREGKETKTLSKLFYIILGFIGFGLMFLTGSRGPLIALILTMLCYAVIFQKNIIVQVTNLLKFSLPIIVLIFILSVLPINFAQYSSIRRIFDFFSGISSEGILAQDPTRILFLKTSVEGFIESRGFGVGTGGFADLIGRDGQYPHNIFLEIGVEQGVFGLIVLLLILIRTYQKMKKENNENNNWEYSLNFIWIFSLFTMLFSGNISSNAIWMAMLFVWINKENINKTNHLN